MAVDTGQGRVRARPGGAGLPVAFEGAVMAADTSEETPVGMKNISVPNPLRERLGRIQAHEKVTRGPRSFWMIVEEALDAAGYEK